MEIKFKNCLIRHVNFEDCEKCDQSKALLKEHGIRFATLTCDKQAFGDVSRFTKSMNIPQIILNGEFIGGHDELVKHFENN